MTATELPGKAIVGDVFSWTEVSAVHRVRNGIYHRNGRLISLLTDFGRITPCYPDYHGESTDVIYYTGSGRHGDQKLDPPNRALFDAMRSGHAVPLFNKLSVGRWEFTGLWRVVDGVYIFDEKQNRMLWKFTLKRVP
ncbi:MAG TPA: YDG/SRA domain-containing protein [Pyrinomonadaceae bacterium]